MSAENKWYVLHVRTGAELDIAKQLESRGFTAVVPLENRIIRKGGKWNEQTYIVFDGYVFVYMCYAWSKYYIMSKIDGIIKLLGGGKSPIPLEKDEVEFVLELTDLLKKPSVLRFADDNSYEIVSGFLADYRDKIIKLQRRYKKATVKITIAGEQKEITVSFIEQTLEQTEG